MNLIFLLSFPANLLSFTMRRKVSVLLVHDRADEVRSESMQKWIEDVRRIYILCLTQTDELYCLRMIFNKDYFWN